MSNAANDRATLWKRINETTTPEQVVVIMRGQAHHYGVMSADQYAPGHSKLNAARNQCWDAFWDALYDRR